MSVKNVATETIVHNINSLKGSRTLRASDYNNVYIPTGPRMSSLISFPLTSSWLMFPWGTSPGAGSVSTGLCSSASNSVCCCCCSFVLLEGCGDVEEGEEEDVEDILWNMACEEENEVEVKVDAGLNASCLVKKWRWQSICSRRKSMRSVGDQIHFQTIISSTRFWLVPSAMTQPPRKQTRTSSLHRQLTTTDYFILFF